MNSELVIAWAHVKDLLLDSLSERDRMVIEMRYGLADGNRCEFKEIGSILGISSERVRQINSKALCAVRRTAGGAPREMPLIEAIFGVDDDLRSIEAVYAAISMLSSNYKLADEAVSDLAEVEKRHNELWASEHAEIFRRRTRDNRNKRSTVENPEGVKRLVRALTADIRRMESGISKAAIAKNLGVQPEKIGRALKYADCSDATLDAIENAIEEESNALAVLGVFEEEAE